MVSVKRRERTQLSPHTIAAHIGRLLSTPCYQIPHQTAYALAMLACNDGWQRLVLNAVSKLMWQLMLELATMKDSGTYGVKGKEKSGLSRYDI